MVAINTSAMPTAPVVATKTLAAFEAAVAYDQGNAFRMWLERVLPTMSDAYKQEHDLFRSHLGASIAGNSCERAIWYSFRWATPRQFSGQMIRLFNRGHLEEARFIALLLTIGCTVYQQDANGKQFRVSDAGGHWSGSSDGVFVGCPDLPDNTPALSEFKTHNDKSFEAVRTQGVQLSKPTHYLQMQQYMRKMGLDFGVYFAVNKDTDEIYAEVIALNIVAADNCLSRAIAIIPMHTPPKRIKEDASWYECKMCDHRPVCHMSAPPHSNCRTCQFSEPRPDGTWYCNNKERQMKMIFGPEEGVANDGENFFPTKARQQVGCSMWTKSEAYL
jgi:hypothetical protein